MININLNSLAGGATAEQINREIERVLENIQDPNTDQTAKRKLTITMTFIPDKNDCDVVDISTVCKAALAPSNGTSTRFVVGKNQKGEIEANEWGKNAMKEQMTIVVDEDGEILDKHEGIIDLQARAN